LRRSQPKFLEPQKQVISKCKTLPDNLRINNPRLQVDGLVPTQFTMGFAISPLL